MTKSYSKMDWFRFGGPFVLIVTTGFCYARSFSGPMVFDDEVSVGSNETIRHLWPIGATLCPPADGSPVTGRPLVNLSFALNYAWGGLRVGGYHVVNLMLHLGSTLILLGIIRRTVALFDRPQLKNPSHVRSWTPLGVALPAAALWSLHPLQTESIAYISGRTEALMGLFYLLTLYAFIRGTGRRFEDGESDHRLASSGWLALSVGSSLAGMAAKEVMVTAPLIVLLYDRTFAAGSFSKALRLRRLYYLSLGLSWVPLIWLVAQAGSRGGTAGYGTTMYWVRYAATQGEAIVQYLRLSLWPHPLAIDYGANFGGSPFLMGCCDLLVVTLLVLTLFALRRIPWLGFVGAWFFLILAPSSSVVPVATELVAEHRIYLSLASVCVLATLLCFRWVGSSGGWVLLGIALALAALTIRRVSDYRSPVALWSSAVKAVVHNAAAHNNLGGALLASGEAATAIPELERSLEIDPSLAGARNNLGLAFEHEGRWSDAVAQFSQANKIAPTYGEAALNLASALARLGQWDRAAEAYQKALVLLPSGASARFAFGNVLVKLRRFPEAEAQFEEALRLAPNDAEIRGNLGGVLMELGRLPEAILQYQMALRTEPGLVEARVNLASAYLETGRTDEAIAAYETAIGLNPGNSAAHYNLGMALRSVGRNAEAEFQFSQSITLRQTMP